MSVRDLAVLYFLVGVPLGVIAYRRGGRFALASLAGTALLWPLWAPFSVLAPAAARASRDARRPAADRLARALSAVEDAARGAALSPALLDEVHAAVARLAQRIEDLEAALSASRARLVAGDRGPAAEVQQRALARLQRLRDESVAALDGLMSLLSALSASEVLSRFEASGGEPLDDLVAQLQAHLELLGSRDPSPPR